MKILSKLPNRNDVANKRIFFEYRRDGGGASRRWSGSTSRGLKARDRLTPGPEPASPAIYQSSANNGRSPVGLPVDLKRGASTYISIAITTFRRNLTEFRRNIAAMPRIRLVTLETKCGSRDINVAIIFKKITFQYPGYLYLGGSRSLVIDR